MRKLLLAILAVLLLVSGSVSHAWEAEAERETLRVVMDNNYPPYAFEDSDGILKGISIDLWHAFSRVTGIPVELQGMDWSEAMASFNNGEADVIDTIFYSAEREANFDYTESYATIDVPIYFTRDLSGITGPEALIGFPVAAKLGDNAISVLNRIGLTDIRTYDSYAEIIAVAATGHEHVFVMDKPSALYYLYRNGLDEEFRETEPIYVGTMHRAVREGDKELLRILNEGFERIPDPDVKAIEAHWLGNVLRAGELPGWLFLVLGACVAGGGALFILNRSLRSRISAQTQSLRENLKKLERNEARIRALLEAIPDMIFVIDDEGRFLEYHGSSHGALYVPPEVFIGRTLREMLPHETAQVLEASIDRARSGHGLQTIEYEMEMEHRLHIYEARIAQSADREYIGIVRDITEQTDANRKLEVIGSHDGLTGLYNRAYFEKAVLLIGSRDSRTTGVAICDLDGLKLVNDTLGHEQGDYCLRVVADRITELFPEPALAARIGGDEFGVVVLDMEEAQFRARIVQLRQVIMESLENVGVPVSVSVGTRFIAGGRPDVSGMMAIADRRMYREKLHRKQSVRHEMVQALRKMLEARDYITDGHGERMESLVVSLAAARGIPENDWSDLRLFAQFHDIGKVGIPDAILFKPGRLSEPEFEVMKRHTEIGYHIALSSLDLVPIADWVLKHHEHWNGCGYPLGLSGEDIPLPCRILSIVDAYDAMTNDRSYRDAMTREQALGELSRCAGSQFDPALVSSFVALLS